MDDPQLERLHQRFDTLLAQIAQVSERIARIEAQEENHKGNLDLFWMHRWPEMMRRVDKLYEKTDALESKQAADVLAATEKRQAILAEVNKSIQPESRFRKASKGTGIVAVSGLIAAVIKALWDAFSQ